MFRRNPVPEVIRDGGRFADKNMRLLYPVVVSISPCTESPLTNDVVTRFFGGSPLSVVVRIILLSILVGVILAAIGLDPWNIIDSVRRLIVHIWNMGFDAVRWLWQYFLLGAVIVLPIWFLARLAKAPRGG